MTTETDIGGLVERLNELLFDVSALPDGGFAIPATGRGSYQDIEATAEQAASALTSLQSRLSKAEGERNEALRSSTIIAKDTGERRAAAKKLLCDICACSAETDPASLDLPHVVEGCIEPLETLIAERDACLFMATETRRLLGPDGPMVLDAMAEASAAKSEAAALRVERDELKALATKVDAIRNSIIGCQRVNWSEHIYPLVAALGEAGFEGLEYEEARENVGTLIEQIKAAEAREAALRGRFAKPIGMQDVRLVAGEGKLGDSVVLRAVNVIIAHRARDA